MFVAHHLFAMHPNDDEAIKAVLAFLYENGRVHMTNHPIMKWGADFLHSGVAYQCLLDENKWQTNVVENQETKYDSLLLPQYCTAWLDEIKRLSNNMLAGSPNAQLEPMNEVSDSNIELAIITVLLVAVCSPNHCQITGHFPKQGRPRQWSGRRCGVCFLSVAPFCCPSTQLRHLPP
jgi:hypothetical protein